MDNPNQDHCRGALKTSKVCQTIVLVVCLTECSMLGGAYQGWASMAFILTQDGIYQHLCGNLSSYRGNVTGLDTQNLVTANTTGSIVCPEQEAQLSLAFMIGLIMYGVGSVPIGWLFDWLGLWFVRKLAWLLAVLGYSCLGFSNYTTSWAIYPGCICIGISCSSLILTNMHICGLAGAQTALWVTIYNGALNGATASYLLMKVAFENDVSRSNIIIFYLLLWTVVPVINFVVLPRGKVEEAPNNSVSPMENQRVFKQNGRSESSTAKTVNGAAHGNQQHSAPSVDKPLTITVLAKSTMYIGLSIWLSLMHMRSVAFIGFYNGWINEIVMGDTAQVSYFIDVLGITQVCGIFIGPMSGVLIDLVRKSKQDLKLDKMYSAILGLPSVLITTGAALVLSVLVLIMKSEVVYVAVVVAEVLRSFCYATGLAMLSLCFPTQHYGKLFGGIYCCLALGTVLQIAHTFVIERVGYIPVHVWLLLTSLVSLLFPAVILVRHRKKYNRTRVSPVGNGAATVPETSTESNGTNKN